MQQTSNILAMTRLYLLVLIVSLVHHVHGRHHVVAFAAQVPKTKQQQQQMPNVAVEQRKAGMTGLRFEASTEYATQPAKYAPDVLEKIFFSDENRNQILAGKSHNRVELLQTPNLELYHLWQVEASKNSSRDEAEALPQVGDPILRVTTTAIRFPGLTLKTIATVGCKNISTEKNALELRITLITDELQADGPKPLVWVFYQLTGTAHDGKNNIHLPFFPKNNNRPKTTTSSSERRTHSTNTISAIPTDSGVVFQSRAMLKIDMSFPSLLLNILPVSKEMAEQQGNRAIKNVVERDIGPSLEALRQRYLDLIEEKTEQDQE